MVRSPSVAALGDLTKAYLDTYVAWEQCADNLAGIRVINDAAARLE